MYKRLIALCTLFVFMLAFVSAARPATAQDGDCVIPESGPWPPCATGGSAPSPTTPPNNSGDCIIPESGPWPPCATGGGGSAPAPTPSPSNGDDCVIPESGPWPPCATGGSGSTPAPAPTPATPAQPLKVLGSGDDVVSVERTRQFQMVRISGNQCGRHFAVWSIDSNLENVDLLVNTSDPYHGVVLIDINREDTLAGFDVSADCNWSIEFLPISAAQVMSKPGHISGANDDVVAVSSGGVMDIVANNGERHFAIWAYDGGGNRLDLLVNTTDSYNGTVRVPNGTRYLGIDAVGNWTLSYP